MKKRTGTELLPIKCNHVHLSSHEIIATNITKETCCEYKLLCKFLVSYHRTDYIIFLDNNRTIVLSLQ